MYTHEPITLTKPRILTISVPKPGALTFCSYKPSTEKASIEKLKKEKNVKVTKINENLHWPFELDIKATWEEIVLT